MYYIGLTLSADNELKEFMIANQIASREQADRILVGLIVELSYHANPIPLSVLDSMYYKFCSYVTKDVTDKNWQVTTPAATMIQLRKFFVDANMEYFETHNNLSTTPKKTTSIVSTASSITKPYKKAEQRLRLPEPINIPQQLLDEMNKLIRLFKELEIENGSSYQFSGSNMYRIGYETTDDSAKIMFEVQPSEDTFFIDDETGHVVELTLPTTVVNTLSESEEDEFDYSG